MVGHAKRVALAVVLALATTSIAHADKPTRRERKKAANLIREARRAKQMGDRYVKRRKFRERAMARYDKAARKYIEAFDLVPLDPVVFELAEVYDARGYQRWALRGYRRYLELAPEGRHAARAEARVAALEGEVDFDADEPGDASLEPTAVFGEEVIPEPEPEPEPEPPLDEDEDGGLEPEPESEPEPEPEPKRDSGPPKPGRTLRWSGIGAAGLGVVFIGLGVKYGGDASSAADELSNKEGAWTDEDRKLIDEGESAETKAVAFTLLGVASIGAGVYLYYLGMDKDSRASEEARVVWVPEVTPTGAGVTVMGRF